MKQFIFFVLLFCAIGSAHSQNFKIGDKVEAYNSGEWYKASIEQIGSGNYNGYYYVHYDQYSNGQWIKASNIRLVKAASAVASAPRNGMYVILSYGNPTNPIRIGYFDLKGGSQYVYYDAGKKQIGSGTYSYDSKTKTITWKSGPFKEAKWGGAFEIDREGKTHKIRLNRATIGTNSMDAA